MTDPAPEQTDRDLALPGRRWLPAARLRWRTSTSGGPGGQHANRTASRVELIVEIADLPLTAREIARIWERLASRITGTGVLTTSSADSRDQHRNRRIALRRMEQLIADALRESRPRIATRPGTGARLRRRASKQQAARRKQDRSWRWDGED